MEVLVPERLDASTVRSLDAALQGGIESGEPVALRGGDPFCSGLALDSVDAGADLRGFARLLHRLRTAPVPSVALVEGSCLAGGLGLAAACDVVLATRRARFGLSEALLGLVPATIWPLLQERVAPQRLRLLALRGSSLDAHAALGLGLVDRIVEEPERALRQELRALRRAAPRSVAWLKAAPDLLAALQDGADRTALCLADPAVRQAAARLAAGEPAWSRS